VSGRRNDLQVSEHFRLYEGECHGRDCCGGSVIHVPALWECLERFRSRIGRPLSPNCVYRCAKHNAEVGGSPTSDHLSGQAADLPCPPGWALAAFAHAALEAGFLRVRVYLTRGFVHASVADRPGLPVYSEEA
jgi:zinc D-Ala-D-Ala carboxypeptidase